MPTECPANITETCQCGHHDQLLVPNVEGTSVCNMAPSLPADEVAGASSANSFCPQVPKMFHDTDFILKLLIRKAWSTGAEPGSSKRARSWNPCRISHLLEHVSVILLIKYICLGHLLWPEESFEYPGWFIENRLMQDPPCSHPYLPMLDRWMQSCSSWDPCHMGATIKLTESHSRLENKEHFILCSRKLSGIWLFLPTSPRAPCLSWITPQLLNKPFCSYPLLPSALFSTQQPEWLSWNVSQIRSPLCANSCTCSLFPTEWKPKSLQCLQNLTLSGPWLPLWPVPCPSLPAQAASTPPLVSLSPCMDTSSPPPEGLCSPCSLYLNPLPLVANKANLLSLSLCSNLAFWIKCPQTTLLNTTFSTWNQPWIFIGRTDADAEAPVLWQPDRKSQLIGKDPDAGKDWRQNGGGVAEHEMVGWHHWLHGHKLEPTRKIVKDREAWHAESMGSQRVGHNWVTEQPPPIPVQPQNSQCSYCTFSFHSTSHFLT